MALTRQEQRKIIEQHIARREQRIRELQAQNNDALSHIIRELEHANMAIIHLQHDLRLCDCPPQAYEQKEG